MKSKWLSLFLLIVIFLSSCTQRITPLVATLEVSQPQPATLTFVATPNGEVSLPRVTASPQPTLPPTLTPRPALLEPTAVQTAFYTQQKLSVGDQAAYDQALKDIPVYRQGNLQLTLLDQNSQPLVGYQVRYRQVDHDFMFGGVADPFVTGPLRQAGINTITAYMDWRWIEPEQGKFRLDFANSWLGIDELKSGGMFIKTNNLFDTGEDIAQYFRDVPYDEFLARLYQHIASTVKRFGPAVDDWEAILEPNFGNHNPLQLTKDQYFTAIETSIRAIRDNDPTATVEINFSYPCGGIDWLDNFQFVQEMLDRKIDFDVIGLQFYYNAVIESDGSQMPRMPISEMSACYDRYAKMLAPYNKRVVGSEFSVPSQGGQNGYWGGAWTEDAQAQYLDTAYPIFFSKPLNLGLVWWNTVEPSSFVRHGGLFNEDGSPKKAGIALQRLIQSWTTTGEGVTDAKGNITWRGFAGNYALEITNPASGEWMTAQTHVTEQESNDVTIRFISNNLLMEKKARLEKLVSYWASQSDLSRVQMGKDALALVDHHLEYSEWALAEQTLDAGLNELAIRTEITLRAEDWVPVGYDFGFVNENGSAVMWGSTFLIFPYPFSSGTAVVEITAHAHQEKGESALMVAGVGANYSQVWKVSDDTAQVYKFSTPITGNEQVLTIRFPYDGRINERINSQNGQVGELKLYIDSVKLVITSSEIPKE